MKWELGVCFMAQVVDDKMIDSPGVNHHLYSRGVQPSKSGDTDVICVGRIGVPVLFDGSLIGDYDFGWDSYSQATIRGFRRRC